MEGAGSALKENKSVAHKCATPHCKLSLTKYVILILNLRKPTTLFLYFLIFLCLCDFIFCPKLTITYCEHL